MATIQGIYLALFGRPADPAGLAYFNGVTNNGANLAGIANLAGQAEYTARFTGMNNTQIINSIYQSLFGRDGETAGVNFWLEKLTSGALSINNIAIAILDGAQGTDKAVIDAKLAAADLFTTHLDLPAEQTAYNNNTSALIKNYLATINATKAATGTEIDAVIQAMLTSGGQGPDDGQNPGGGGEDPAATFTIVNSETGVVFGGTATGEITLGIEEGDSLTLTGLRGGVAATFPEGSIVVEKSIDLSALVANVVLTDNLHVSATAAEANGFAISGTGHLTLTGSDGSQTVTVDTTGHNSINGGAGADAINLGEAGSDTVIVDGVDTALITAVTDAEAALDGKESADQLAANLEGANSALADARETASDDAVAQDVTDAEAALAAAGDPDTLKADDDAADALVTDRDELSEAASDAAAALASAQSDLGLKNQAVGTAENAVDAAQTAFNTAKGNSDTTSQKLIAEITSSIRAELADAYNQWPDSNGSNKTDVTNRINSLNIDSALKTALIGQIPNNNFDGNAAGTTFLNKILPTVTTFLGTGDSAAKLNALSASAISLELKQAYDSGWGSDSSSDNRTQVIDRINLFDLPSDLETALKAQLPSGQSGTFYTNTQRDAYLAKIAGIVSTYTSGLSSAQDTAQTTLNTAKSNLEDAQDAAAAAQNTFDAADEANDAAAAALQAHVTLHGDTSTLVQHAADTQAALEAYGEKADAADAAHAASEARDALVDAATHAQELVDERAELDAALDTAQHALDAASAGSVVGAEDVITHFHVGEDHLTLPSSDIVTDDSGTFNFADHAYQFSVVNGVLTFTSGDAPVIPTGEQINALLTFIANDNIVADGQTVVFAYDEDAATTGNEGVYVFQGHAGSADIGVKLAGLSLSDLTSASDLFYTAT